MTLRQSRIALTSTHELQRLNEIREARALNALQIQRAQVRHAIEQRESCRQMVVSLREEFVDMQAQRVNQRHPEPEWLRASEEAERWLEEDIQNAQKQLAEATANVQDQRKVMLEKQGEWTRLRMRAEGLRELADEQRKTLTGIAEKRAVDALDDVNSGTAKHG